MSDDATARDGQAAGAPEKSIDLLRRAQAGDARALDRLLARYLPRLTRWARGRLPRRARSLEDTGDLVQEAVLHALERLEHFEPRHDGALQAYLRQAIVHRIQNNLRGAARKPPGASLPEEWRDAAPSPFDEAVGAEALARYEAALGRLRDEDRALIVLRVELRYDYAQIADATGKATVDAARVAVGRALVRLAREMGHAA